MLAVAEAKAEAEAKALADALNKIKNPRSR